MVFFYLKCYLLLGRLVVVLLLVKLYFCVLVVMFRLICSGVFVVLWLMC